MSTEQIGKKRIPIYDRHSGNLSAAPLHQTQISNVATFAQAAPDKRKSKQRSSPNEKLAPKLAQKLLRRQSICCMICREVFPHSTFSDHITQTHGVRKAKPGLLKRRFLFFAFSAYEAQMLCDFQRVAVSNSKPDARTSKQSRTETFLHRRPLLCCRFCHSEVFLDMFEPHLRHCDRSDIYLGGKVLPFRIFPPGDPSMCRDLVKGYIEVYGKVLEGERLDWDRFDFVVEKLKPNATAFGTDGWLGYVVFTFAERNAVLLESVRHGHAAYVLTGDWKRKIHLSRAIVRRLGGFDQRVVHKGEWRDRIRWALGVLSRMPQSIC